MTTATPNNSPERHIPSEKLTVKQSVEKLATVSNLVGAYPHSTRELNMMAALIDPIYQEDGVVDYVNEVVSLEHDESQVGITEEMVGFYRDALMNIRDLTALLHQIEETGGIEISKDKWTTTLAALAVVRRHEDTALFMAMPEILTAYLDDDYSQMDNVAYGNLLMGNKNRDHVHDGIEATLLAEYDRAAFWLEQITGSNTQLDEASVLREGLIDSSDPEVQSYLEQIAGIEKPAYQPSEFEETADTVFAIGKRPRLGDTTRWEKFKHRNRLNDIFHLHGFFAQTNKEAEKVKYFDYLKNDPAAVLKWMDMINESNRRWEVAKGKDSNPSERLDALVNRFVEYADDAIANDANADFILQSIDEKSDDEALLRDTFPSDEWFRDYPEYRQPFIKLAEFVQTKEFIKNGAVDTITKKARARKKPTVQDEIDLIMNKLGNLPLVKVAELTEDYKMDQTNRFAYWQEILKTTSQHRMIRPLVDQALSRLVGVGPRYIDPENPANIIEPTSTDTNEEIPF